MKSQLKYLIILVLLINNGGVFAQDGEGLFKAKCNTCHALKKNSIGPMLQGVKQKWIDAEEGELIYEWVKNSEMLIASGNSKMAKAIEGFSKSKMSAQDVNKEEVDAILDYVDNWTEPVAEENPTDPNAEVEVIYVPNYHTNLNVFYALLAMVIVLLIAIAMISGAIKRYIASDYFKERLGKMDEVKDSEIKSGGLKNLILVIIGTTLIANSSNALEFLQPGDAVEGQPWLLVETSDLYALVALNILLLGVLLYLRRLFNGFVDMVTEKQEAEKEEPAVISKVSKLLTDVVPIEEEETIMLHHEYDGIRELDNNLPPWWVWMFYATIIFGVVYIFNYHILGTSDLQIAEYDKEMVQAETEKEVYRKAMAMNIDETNAVEMTEASDISTGKKLFATNCVTCHSAKGEGNIGPNLTDNTWIYGYDIASIYKTIRVGSPNGKMPEHESKLNPIEIQQVASFVMSMPDAEGSEPQGEIIQE
jgi:cytochrome c oxidase cbb3-type subunit 3